jgi:hypothetical protein
MAVVVEVVDMVAEAVAVDMAEEVAAVGAIDSRYTAPKASSHCM